MRVIRYTWTGVPIPLPTQGNFTLHWNGVLQTEGIDYVIVGGLSRQFTYPAIIGGLVPNVGDTLIAIFTEGV